MRPVRLATYRDAKAAELPRLAEADFQRQVIQAAKVLGWLVYHPFLSKFSQRGFPDLTLVRPPRIMLVELKSDAGKLSPDQLAWQTALIDCPGVEYHLWRPVDWAALTELLR